MSAPEVYGVSVNGINTLQISQQIRDFGFAYLESFKPHLTTMQIAAELGDPIEILGIPIVQRIIPREQENAPRTLYSGNYGLGDFPLHTDLAHWYVPPHYIILRCIAPSPNVFTRLIEFSECLKEIPESTIRRAQFLPRRNIANKKHLLRIYQEIGGQDLLRWDELFIVPANREAIEVQRYLIPAMWKCSTLEISLLHSADTLIIDNWRMLHGRSSVSTIGVERILERTYLERFKE